MDKKNFIKTVKEMFSAVEETTEQKFVDVKTTDGLILRADDIAPEMTIQEVTENGLVELNDGDYVLEDGLTLVVEAGKIKEILEATAEEMEEEVEVETETFETVVGASAYMELPVGTHTIGDKIYVVESVIKNEGMEDEYTANEITSITPVEGTQMEEETEFAEVVAEEVPAEPVTPETEEEGEYVAVADFNAYKDEVKSMFDELKAELETLKSEKQVTMSALEKVNQEFSAFKGEPSAKPLNKTYDFSALTKDEKLKALRR